MPNDAFNGPDESYRASFLERLGVRPDGEGNLVLVLGAAHLRTLGIAHGGVIATLLDSVMGMNAHKTSPSDHYLVTAQLNVHFLRPAFEGETLVASADVRHAGRKTAMAQGELRTSGGELVATASATFLYVAHTEQTRAHPDRLEPITGPRPGP